MCMLAYCKSRKLTWDEFDSCWSFNNDGMGIAYLTKDKLFSYIKGFMNKETAWNFYKKFPKGPHVIHFRLGTSGAPVGGLTHPFVCSEKSPLTLRYAGEEGLLFHNGVLYEWEDWCKSYDIPITSLMSDTRALAILIGKFGTDALKKVKDRGKFIYLKDGKIMKMGKFIEEDGIFFSNSGYLWGARYSSYDTDYDYYAGVGSYNVRSKHNRATRKAGTRNFRTYGKTDRVANKVRNATSVTSTGLTDDEINDVYEKYGLNRTAGGSTRKETSITKENDAATYGTDAERKKGVIFDYVDGEYKKRIVTS